MSDVLGIIFNVCPLKQLQIWNDGIPDIFSMSLLRKLCILRGWNPAWLSRYAFFTPFRHYTQICLVHGDIGFECQLYEDVWNCLIAAIRVQDVELVQYYLDRYDIKDGTYRDIVAKFAVERGNKDIIARIFAYYYTIDKYYSAISIDQIRAVAENFFAHFPQYAQPDIHLSDEKRLKIYVDMEEDYFYSNLNVTYISRLYLDRIRQERESMKESDKNEDFMLAAAILLGEPIDIKVEPESIVGDLMLSVLHPQCKEFGFQGEPYFASEVLYKIPDNLTQEIYEVEDDFTDDMDTTYRVDSYLIGNTARMFGISIPQNIRERYDREKYLRRLNPKTKHGVNITGIYVIDPETARFLQSLKIPFTFIPESFVAAEVGIDIIDKENVRWRIIVDLELRLKYIQELYDELMDTSHDKPTDTPQNEESVPPIIVWENDDSYA